MKEKVTEFLGNLPKSGSEQFNKALELYRKSKNHSASNVRFLNEQGYSPARLEILLYELKKLHSTTDLEVAKARRRKKDEEPVAPSKEELQAEFIKNIVADNLEDLNDEECEAVIFCFCELFEQEKPEGVEDRVLLATIQDYFVKNAGKEFTLDLSERKAPAGDSGKDPDVVLVPVKDFDTVPSGDDQQATQEASEATDDSMVVTLENTNEVPSPETLESSEATQETFEATSAEHQMSSEERDEQAKGALAEKEKFLKQDLADFDVEAEKYNAIKSFAAVLSDYINEDPKDQKGETLKAFILDAKKKYLES